VLCRVHTCLEWRGPTRGRDGGALVLRAFDGLEVDQQGDCILSLWYAVVWFASRNTSRSTGHHAGRKCDILQDPAADVNVMGREVVAWAKN
jgi:hypothetical protein